MWLDRILDKIFKEECKEEDLGMKMIVGLGNPGMEYVGTRHNVGFEVIDRICEANSIDFNKEKFQGVYGQGIIAGQKVIVVKPMTYMNNSGECVGALAKYYKMEPEDIIVIFDDINLDVGQLRIRGKGSAGGHNGIKSIIAHLHSENFPHIRVGVGMKQKNQDLVKHVLSRFSAEQQEDIAAGMDLAAEAAAVLVTGDVTKAMNDYNGKKGKE